MKGVANERETAASTHHRSTKTWRFLSLAESLSAEMKQKEAVSPDIPFCEGARPASAAGYQLVNVITDQRYARRLITLRGRLSVSQNSVSSTNAVIEWYQLYFTFPNPPDCS